MIREETSKVISMRNLKIPPWDSSRKGAFSDEGLRIDQFPGNNTNVHQKERSHDYTPEDTAQ